MNKIRIWTSRIALTIMTFSTITGCSVNLEGEHQTRETEPKSKEVVEHKEEPIEVVVEIYIDDSKQEEYSHIIRTISGTSVLDFMEDNYRLVERDGAILCIEGNRRNLDEGKYWLFEINGNLSTIGVDEYELKDGDEVIWRLGTLE